MPLLEVRQLAIAYGDAPAVQSAWRVKATIFNSRATTRRDGARRSTRPGWSTRRRAPQGTGWERPPWQATQRAGLVTNPRVRGSAQSLHARTPTPRSIRCGKSNYPCAADRCAGFLSEDKLVQHVAIVPLSEQTRESLRIGRSGGLGTRADRRGVS